MPRIQFPSCDKSLGAGPIADSKHSLARASAKLGTLILGNVSASDVSKWGCLFEGTPFFVVQGNQQENHLFGPPLKQHAQMVPGFPRPGPENMVR